jgi:hypothetical protein
MGHQPVRSSPSHATEHIPYLRIEMQRSVKATATAGHIQTRWGSGPSSLPRSLHLWYQGCFMLRPGRSSCPGSTQVRKHRMPCSVHELITAAVVLTAERRNNARVCGFGSGGRYAVCPNTGNFTSTRPQAWPESTYTVLPCAHPRHRLGPHRSCSAWTRSHPCIDQNGRGVQLGAQPLLTTRLHGGATHDRRRQRPDRRAHPGCAEEGAWAEGPVRAGRRRIEECVRVLDGGACLHLGHEQRAARL